MHLQSYNHPRLGTLLPGIIFLVSVLLASGCGGGKDSEDSTQSVPSGSDITPPVVTLAGEKVMTLVQDVSFIDPGAIAVDETDGSVTVVTTGKVDTSKPGDYLLTYTAQDRSGNRALATRTVTILPKPGPPSPGPTDSLAPVISLNGANPLHVNQGQSFQDPGATAIDAFDVRSPYQGVDLLIQPRPVVTPEPILPVTGRVIPP